MVAQTYVYSNLVCPCHLSNFDKLAHGLWGQQGVERRRPYGRYRSGDAGGFGRDRDEWASRAVLDGIVGGHFLRRAALDYFGRTL